LQYIILAKPAEQKSELQRYRDKALRGKKRR